MTRKYSDFKIISISLIAVLIFFTLTYFRYIPLKALNINIEDFSQAFNNFYFVLVEFIALILSVIFVLIYSKKSDKELIKRYKSIATGVGAIVFYFIFPFFEIIPFLIFDADPSYLPMELKVTYLIAFLSLMLAIVCFIYQKQLLKDWKDFKKKANEYFSQNIKYWLIALAGVLATNWLIQHFISNNSIARNEQSIRNMLKQTITYTFFSAVIYAPIMEELIFRLSFKKIFSNKWFFIIVSGLLFGSLHVLTDLQSITDLFFIIPYSIPGFVFAYMLEKNDNIFVPISFHLMHNGIMVSLLTLISLL